MITQDRFIAEDIVQSAFLRVFKKIAGFDDSLPFRPWFLRIVVNDSIKMVTQQKRRVNLPDEENGDYQKLLEDLTRVAREPEEAIQHTEIVNEIKQAIVRLSPAQRAAIVMYYFLQMDTAEISNFMEINAGTVRWHLSVAREKLRKSLISLK